HHTVHQGWRPEAITQEMLALYGDRVERSLWPSEETAPLVVSSSREDLSISAVWELGLDDFPTSPIFVPRDPGANPGFSRYAGSDPGGHDGWVVVPIMNDAGFRVEVFDAAAVDRGPLAVLSSPGFTVPFVLHSAWMPRAVPAADLARVRFADELGRIGELDDDLQAVVHRVAADLEDGVPLTA
ncbi:MAG: carotenoid oxygenase, partial [Actinobacteria bacterium]|nr:carotenoid oxygenase [Actinomycetota bacterium]